VTTFKTTPIQEFEAGNPPAGAYWVNIRHMFLGEFGGQQDVRMTQFRWEIAWWRYHRLSVGTGEMLWDVAGAWQTSAQLGIFRVGPWIGNTPRDMIGHGVVLDLPR
jgi:hypothetical protein